jgi:hypothetical protein
VRPVSVSMTPEIACHWLRSVDRRERVDINTSTFSHHFNGILDFVDDGDHLLEAWQCHCRGNEQAGKRRIGVEYNTPL